MRFTDQTKKIIETVSVRTIKNFYELGLSSILPTRTLKFLCTIYLHSRNKFCMSASQWENHQTSSLLRESFHSTETEITFSVQLCPSRVRIKHLDTCDSRFVKQPGTKHKRIAFYAKVLQLIIQHQIVCLYNENSY